jgi:hypothetical protein
MFHVVLIVEDKEVDGRFAANEREIEGAIIELVKINNFLLTGGSKIEIIKVSNGFNRL